MKEDEHVESTNKESESISRYNLISENIPIDEFVDKLDSSLFSENISRNSDRTQPVKMVQTPKDFHHFNGKSYDRFQIRRRSVEPWKFY